MAKLMDDEITRISFPITKFEEDADGNLIVEGVVTDGSVDSDEQIVDPEFSAKALSEWMESGPNLRVMHSPHLMPAGRGLKVELGSFSHTLKALVVEDTAKKLVRNKVLRAYSVGIARPVIERDVTGKARGGVITGGELCEVSLVDRPANRSCQITLAKSEDNEVPWTVGDLGEALAKSESGGNEKASVDTYAEWREAHKAWTASEPVPTDAVQGPEYLAKRAEWHRWRSEGNEDGLGEDGYAVWLVKRQQTVADDDELAEGETDQGTTASSVDAPATGTAVPAEIDVQAEDAEEEPSATKASKDCPACGASYHADSKKRRCTKCDGKLPQAAEVEKGDARCKCCPKCSVISRSITDCDCCDKCDSYQKENQKSADPDFSANPEEESVEKTADPVAEVDTDKPSEAGAGDDKDKKPPFADMKKSAEYAAWRMHDATCAAYHQGDVTEEYPAVKSVADAMDVGWWQSQVAGSANKGDFDALADMVDCARYAEAIKATESAVLDDARELLHKSFAQMYPDAKVRPGKMTPGRFHRPYLRAGRASQNASGNRRANVPSAGYTPDPDDFDRGPNSDPARPSGNTSTGSSRTYYTNAAKEAARNAMQNMHDHIASTFPDMCPMASSVGVLPPDMGDTNRPHAVTPPKVGKAPGEKAEEPKVKKSKKKTKTSDAPALDAAALTEIVTKAAQKSLDEMKLTYENQLAALQTQLDELGSQPDPAQAPVRGVVRKAATQTAIAPVERRSLVAEAQEKAARLANAEKAAYHDYLLKMAASGDPQIREKATSVLELEGLLINPA